MKLFTAEWCANCKPIKKYIKESNLTQIQIVDVDTPEGSEIAKESGVRCLPTYKEDGLTLIGSVDIMEHLKNNF